MIGLIYKDLCCLRKHIKIFVILTVGVIALSILFVLSMEYGNVAFMIAEMSEEEFFNLFQMAIWCVMIMPIASSCIIQECFKEDNKANFKKCLYVLPVTEEKLVGGRYLSGLVFLLMGFLGTLAVGICIALSTDVFQFGQMLGYSVTFLALLIFYEAFCMLVLYAVDGKKADLIQCIPFVVLIDGYMTWFIMQTVNMPDEQLTQFLKDLMDKFNDVMVNDCIWILFLALLFMGMSYIGSVFIQKKRGLK